MFANQSWSVTVSPVNGQRTGAPSLTPEPSLVAPALAKGPSALCRPPPAEQVTRSARAQEAHPPHGLPAQLSLLEDFRPQVLPAAK
jgi:hypothetical protein